MRLCYNQEPSHAPPPKIHPWLPTTTERALGLDTRRAYLGMVELADPFRLLEPWECEDFLCIYYKGRLEAFRC